MKYIYIIIFFIVFITLQSCIGDNTKKDDSIQLNDSLALLIQNAKNINYSLYNRKKFLSKAYYKNSAIKNDTLKIRNYSTIAFLNLKLGDTILFKKQNLKALELAEKVKDTFSIGDLSWNYASYYNLIEEYDSSYYYFNKANICFEKTKSKYEAAKTAYGMAFIRGRFNDFTGSEILIFKAIKKFKEIENYEELFSCYNYLSQLENDILEFDRALHYQGIALEYVKKINNNVDFYETYLNNVGLTYLEKGDFEKSLYYFNKKLNNRNLKIENKASYAITIDNKAYAKLLMKDEDSVFEYLTESIQIKDSLKDRAGILISKIHLSEYYLFKKDSLKAHKFASEAKIIAKKIKNGRDYIKTLLLLAKLDSKNANKYYKECIRFKDSLNLSGHKNYNKFTRIEYETDEYIVKNKLLSQQKVWILLASIGLISILVLIFLVKSQKDKSEKLQLENEQQKVNEQIYILTLNHQDKLEKEKVKERNRIAEDLHDSILSKLFGVRVGLGFLEIEGEEKIKKKHQLLLDELQTIEKEIRDVSHQLSDNFSSSLISYEVIISELIENKSKIGNFKCDQYFDPNIQWQNINEIVKMNLYRIVEEAIQNTIKYSFAKNIAIFFLIEDSNLTLKVKDDGIGFNVTQNNKGIGIKNMKSRVKKMNAVFDIQSKPNNGVTIIIQIPI